MQNPYSIFPEIESSDLLLRKTKEEDLPDLLKIYSDKEAAKFFNTDNCHGDDFFYRTIERVRQALDFWNYSYLNKFFVRWAIVDKTSGVVIGTIEQFHRDSTEDHFTNCSLLRLDLRSDYEKEEVMEYIDWSRNFMIGKTSRKDNEPMFFIQPCNPKYYDLEAAFIRDDGVTGWKQSRKVNIGDICYMYIANPVGAVKYKCEVVETDIPFEYKSEDVSITKLMKIKLIKRIDNKIDFKFLKSIGVSLIRGPVSITKDMAEKIDALIKN